MSQTPLAEIAIDVRRAKDLPYQVLVADIADRASKALGVIPDIHECIHLEDWVRPSKSVIWFNRSYWRHLAEEEPCLPREWMPADVSDDHLDITGVRYWGTAAHVFRVRNGRPEISPIVAGESNPALFAATAPDEFLGVDEPFRTEQLRVSRGSDGKPTGLRIGSLVFTRAPYEPASAIPGGIHAAGWRGLRTDVCAQSQFEALGNLGQ